MLDAVEDKQAPLFGFHERPNPAYPVGDSMYRVLDERLGEAREALHASLRASTLADLLAELPPH